MDIVASGFLVGQIEFEIRFVAQAPRDGGKSGHGEGVATGWDRGDARDARKGRAGSGTPASIWILGQLPGSLIRRQNQFTTLLTHLDPHHLAHFRLEGGASRRDLHAPTGGPHTHRLHLWHLDVLHIWLLAYADVPGSLDGGQSHNPSFNIFHVCVDLEGAVLS